MEKGRVHILEVMNLSVFQREYGRIVLYKHTIEHQGVQFVTVEAGKGFCDDEIKPVHGETLKHLVILRASKIIFA